MSEQPRKRTAATRKRISQGMRRRWAERKAKAPDGKVTRAVAPARVVREADGAGRQFYSVELWRRTIYRFDQPVAAELLAQNLNIALAHRPKK